MVVRWSIAIDPNAGHLYWAILDEDKIQRADLDGTNIVDVIDSAVKPRAITLELE